MTLKKCIKIIFWDKIEYLPTKSNQVLLHKMSIHVQYIILNIIILWSIWWCLTNIQWFKKKAMKIPSLCLHIFYNCKSVKFLALILVTFNVIGWDCSIKEWITQGGKRTSKTKEKVLLVLTWTIKNVEYRYVKSTIIV